MASKRRDAGKVSMQVFRQLNEFGASWKGKHDQIHDCWSARILHKTRIGWHFFPTGSASRLLSVQTFMDCLLKEGLFYSDKHDHVSSVLRHVAAIQLKNNQIFWECMSIKFTSTKSVFWKWIYIFKKYICTLGGQGNSYIGYHLNSIVLSGLCLHMSPHEGSTTSC